MIFLVVAFLTSVLGIFLVNKKMRLDESNILCLQEFSTFLNQFKEVLLLECDATEKEKLVYEKTDTIIDICESFKKLENSIFFKNKRLSFLKTFNEELELCLASYNFWWFRAFKSKIEKGELSLSSCLRDGRLEFSLDVRFEKLTDIYRKYEIYFKNR